MKKVMLILGFAIFAIALVSANCSLNVSLVSQDPYPAVPGDYVKLLFQVAGTENPDCNYATLELKNKYPISFDPGTTGFVQIKGGTFQNDYSSSLAVPFKVRLDPNALDGENRIEVVYSSGNNLNESAKSKLFDIEVKDVRADFNVFVKDYDPKTNTLTLEVLNIAKSNVEAVTVTIPGQENVKILGANTNILGDIDSNEYTTADFTVEPSRGNIQLNISYSDAINKRRTIEKEVYFNPDYFTPAVKKATPWYVYLIYVLIIVAIVYFFYARRKKKRERRQMRRGMTRLG